MLLVSIIILFSLLALGLLALLDRYDAAILKAQVARRNAQAQKFIYYDAFTDRRQQSESTPPTGQPERRNVAA
jgi:hypothetical protein